MQEFNPCRKENTTLHCYEDQLVKAVEENNPFTVIKRRNP
jgi:hypothetical protein